MRAVFLYKVDLWLWVTAEEQHCPHKFKVPCLLIPADWKFDF